ncbi:MAG: MBL fold metallo-hydrolase [Chitinophagaceae bacterium]|nr:MBL fold metallo-hydrolase [Chitinophagaceae bacterium]
MEIHFLDMGSEKYGDCIVITQGARKILIDAAHPRDAASIRMQLKKILGKNPPYVFDLLIITHCHSDHIGCLFDLVTLGDIKAKISLLADPVFRWGEEQGGDEDSFSIAGILKEALMEEDRSDMKDEELELFLSDAPRLLPGYKAAIKKLDENGDVIFYRGNDEVDYSSLENKFSDFGLKILGPTAEHLRLTQRSLGVAPITDTINRLIDTVDSNLLLPEAYRRLAGSIFSDSEAALVDAQSKGAINDQSIVIRVHDKQEGWSALLAGDMQFGKPEVSGLGNEMDRLIKTVNEAAPYSLIKLSHHSSHNGVSEELLDTWLRNTLVFAHTGGRQDAGHPDEEVLQMLKERKNDLSFIRNDRNGIMTVGMENDELTFWISKGRVNDFRVNTVSDVVGTEAEKATVILTPPLPVTPSLSTQITDAGFIEVTAKVPNTSTRVTITIDVDPQKKNAADIVLAPATVPPPQTGSRFEGLLFVTCNDRLKINIGEMEAGHVIQWIQRVQGATFLNIPATNDIRQIIPLVQQKINAATRGVVLIGGYDIVPSMQLDVLDPGMRAILIQEGDDDEDDDNFIVWSDDPYGDLDGDLLPELPVSRIPDGKSAELVVNALNAPLFAATLKFGIRNLARPFANEIFDTIPSRQAAPLEISEKCGPTAIGAEQAQGAVYYMLHGVDHDGTRYWGERRGGSMFEAIDINNIPASTPGTVIFTGCCWGALTVQPTASRKTPSVALRPRTPEQSIALAYLKAGALAFVGCTGTHYSPGEAPYNYFGKPMHDAFWKSISGGNPPALALFEAKKEYARNAPHGLTRTLFQAIEMKILRQYTCLGLGW